jgi:replicative DNA helicase
MNQHNKELEQSVLGAILVESYRMPTVATILKEDFFYSKPHQYVYRAIKQLYDDGAAIDLLTVTERLQKIGRLKEVGGSYFLIELTRHVAGAHNIEIHSRKIHEYYILRELTTLGNILITESQSQSADCFDIIEKLQKRAQELTTVITNTVKHVGDVFHELVKDIQDVQEKGVSSGIPMGNKRLDTYTGGWQKGNLLILAARPGMGKTAFALQAAKHPAIALNKPTGIFSLEMTAKELVGRLASSEALVSSTGISQKSISRDDLQRVGASCMKLIDAPIYIDDSPALNLSRLRSIAIKMVYEFKVELIIIDYLQLMSGEKGSGNREQEISKISRGLKALAKELDIPIIALSQLSREVERRPDKRPMLSDLRESGSIEQDADMVMFLWRPEYYDLCEDGYTFGTHVLDSRQLMMIDIAKGRALKTGETPARFIGEYMQIADYRLPGESELSELEPNNDFF